LPRFRSVALLAIVAVLGGCAQAPEKPGAPAVARTPVAPSSLPGAYESTQDCCVKVTLILRPDGAYLIRQVLGPSEFYDFGSWRLSNADGLLFLEGGRDAMRYLVKGPDFLEAQNGVQGGDLKRKPQVEALRGPFRLNGLYDGATFKECRTGLSWPVDDSRAGGDLKQEYRKSAPGQAGKPALVAVDARFVEDNGREEIRIQRLPAILAATACP
jgi:hypothetical protein